MMGVGVDGFKPQSVQQAPGRRGERPPSYNTGRQTMNQKLSAVNHQTIMPKSLWFLAGALGMIALYFYHAFFTDSSS